MKLLQVCLFILMTTALFAETETTVTIKGKIKGEIPEEVMYSLPIKGICNLSFKAAVTPDKNGRFSFTVDTDRAAFLKVGIYGFWARTMVVEPGETYELEIDRRPTPNTFVVKGRGEAGQMLYLDLPQPSFMQETARPYVEKTDAAAIEGELLQERNTQIKQFDDLLKAGAISPEFYELVEADRHCFYAGVIGSVGLIKFFEDNRKKDGQFTDAIKAMWGNAYGDWPARSEQMMRSYWYFQTTKSWLNYLEYTNEDFSEEALSTIYKDGLIHTHNLEIARQHLSSEALAFYTAAYIQYEAFQKKYEKELIDLYEQFRKDYPESPYTVHLTPMIEPIVDFHQKKQDDFGDGISFVQNSEQINSLAELVSTLKGKKVYVDVWATWCGPCKQEFAYNAELQELAQSTDTQILYISVDDAEREQQWKDMIKFYDLRGHHVRVNVALEKELRELFGEGGMIAIPWYMIFDEAGELAETHANRPSELKALGKALNKI
ncbi:MAG: TlpA disulfide reductase family protein [Saprospiraceae bacterium]|nr:TlpA family protein disulfide reductase [Lewinella sp.]